MPGGRASKFPCGKAGGLSQKQGGASRSRAESGRGGGQRGCEARAALLGQLRLGCDEELLQGLDTRNQLNL